MLMIRLLSQVLCREYNMLLESVDNIVRRFCIFRLENINIAKVIDNG